MLTQTLELAFSLSPDERSPLPHLLLVPSNDTFSLTYILSAKVAHGWIRLLLGNT
jgi:hypothetical protein